MSEFRQIKPLLEHRTGDYLTTGFESLAQDAIRERGRFEPQFGAADFSKFAQSMLRILPSHGFYVDQQQFESDSQGDFGVIAEKDAEDPYVIFTFDKKAKQPLMKIKGENPEQKDLTFMFNEEGTKVFAVIGRLEEDWTEIITAEELRQFCSEVFNLYTTLKPNLL